MTTQSDVFGAGGGEKLGAFPAWLSESTFEMTAAEVASTELAVNSGAASGFLRDGDTFRFPQTTTGAMEYYDNTGSLVWSVVPLDIDAGSLAWVGFFLNDTEDLLYVTVNIQSGPGTDKTVWLATIDVTGTINNIANFQVTPITGIGWDWTNNATAGMASMQPIVGTSRAILTQLYTAQTEIFEIDYIAGTFIGRIATLPGFPTGMTGPLDHNRLMSTIANNYNLLNAGNPLLGATYRFFDTLSSELRTPLGWTQFTTNSDKSFYRGGSVWVVNTNSVTQPTDGRTYMLQDHTDANARWLQAMRGISL